MIVLRWLAAWVTQRGALSGKRRALLTIPDAGKWTFWKLHPRYTDFSSAVALRRRIVIWPFYRTLAASASYDLGKYCTPQQYQNAIDSVLREAEQARKTKTEAKWLWDEVAPVDSTKQLVLDAIEEKQKRLDPVQVVAW